MTYKGDVTLTELNGENNLYSRHKHFNEGFVGGVGGGIKI